MPRPRRTPFLVRMRADWREFRGKVGRRIAFRKIRFKRFLKALKARREDRESRRNAPRFPEGPDIHYKSDSRPPKIKRL
ncbi:uncharacterized protein METZ01_LOCUS393117, partial [marine metagenome]